MFDHADHSGMPYKNGHCFVSLAMGLPLLINGRIKYVNIAIHCKVELISAVRVDPATYELPLVPTGKKGRPRYPMYLVPTECVGQ